MNAAFRPRRALGRTGFVATALGIGDLADRAVPLDVCVATLRRALDAGLNLVDTAPMYEDGYSEEIVGAALRGRREGVFVVDKIDLLDRPVAPQVDESLRRLGLPATDLFAFHAVSQPEAWERLAEPGGGLDQLDEEVRRGRTRFRGISSHHPDVLHAAIESGRIDVAMFPVGPFVDPRYVLEILPLARRRGVGTIGFKTFGAGKLVGDTEGYGRPLAARPRGKVSLQLRDPATKGSGRDPEPTRFARIDLALERPSGRSGGSDEAAPTLPRLTVGECLSYTLTLDPDVALLGLSFPNEQDAAFAAARAFRPLAPEEMAELRRRAARAVEGKGAVWWNPPPGPVPD